MWRLMLYAGARRCPCPHSSVRNHHPLYEPWHRSDANAVCPGGYALGLLREVRFSLLQDGAGPSR